MQPFSVLMSVYHRDEPEFLRLALKSVWNDQTIKPDEIVVVKDGSIGAELDAVVDNFAKVAPIVIVALPKNGGLGKALNEGLKQCKNNLVARMDADDISKPDRFEKQLAVFAEHPEYDVVGSWIDEFVGEKDNVVSVRKLPEDPIQIYKFGQSRNPINHPVVMFRKSSVESAGSYRHFPLFEDYSLWVRMLNNHANFYNIQESLLLFRFSSEMVKRRGGLKYAITECSFQYKTYKTGYINKIGLTRNISVRFISRILPNDIRTQIYKRFLRKEIV